MKSNDEIKIKRKKKLEPKRVGANSRRAFSFMGDDLITEKLLPLKLELDSILDL